MRLDSSISRKLKPLILNLMTDPSYNSQHPVSKCPDAPVVWSFNKNEIDRNTFRSIPFAKNILDFLPFDTFEGLPAEESFEYSAEAYALHSALRDMADQGELIELVVRINPDSSLSLVNSNDKDNLGGTRYYHGGFKYFYVHPAMIDEAGYEMSCAPDA